MAWIVIWSPWEATRFLCSSQNNVKLSRTAQFEESEMSENLFLKIIRREIPAEIVYETDEVLAFKDVNPQAPVHLLIIPKMHIRTINDIEPQHSELVGRLFMAAAEIARQEGISEQGYRVVMNCNAAAGQTVFHIHLHLLGGRVMGWPPG
jgi:histidine triad (HIT) family protein